MYAKNYIFILLVLLMSGCFFTKKAVDASAQQNANVVQDANKDTEATAEINKNSSTDSVVNDLKKDEEVEDVLVEDLEGLTVKEVPFVNKPSAKLQLQPKENFEYATYEEYLDVMQAEYGSPADEKEVNKSFITSFFNASRDLDLKEIDQDNEFIADNLFVFNNIPLILLKLDNAQDIAKEAKDVNPAYKYIPNKVRYSDDIKGAEISTVHRLLLQEFVKKTAPNQKVLIVVYSHPNSVKNWEQDDDYKESRVIYTQTLVTYLYKNIKNVRIEYRYNINIPQDELMISAFGYEGTLPFNVYSIASTTGVNWLEANLAIQKDLREKQAAAKAKVQEAITKIGSSN